MSYSIKWQCHLKHHYEKAAEEHCLIAGFDSEKISKEYFMETFEEYRIDNLMFTYKIK